MKQADCAIAAYDIHKHYRGGVEGAGLNGFNLEVRTGEVCGLLGPNGAGKTTAVKILTTLLDFEQGQATVAGFNIRTQGMQVRQQIGLVGQYAAVDEILTGWQNLVMFGQLYHLSKLQAQTRAEELLTQFSLIDSAHLPVSKYSGGMRRRLDLAASLIISPQVLFVDEPTTGLDPMGRREVWAAIRTLVQQGKTVLLTTQYLEEADQLADRISMLKAGRVIAEGTPDELKAAFGGNWLDITLNADDDLQTLIALVQPIACGELHLNPEANQLSVPVMERTTALIMVTKALSEAGITPSDISLRRPTLDEVFIQLASKETVA